MKSSTNISFRHLASAFPRALETARKAARLIYPPVAVLAAAFIVTSCAGSGTTPGPSPFQGSFAGTWTSNATDSGTANIGVTVGGTFTGTETDTTINLQGSVTGNLQNNGTFTGTVQPQGHAPINATGHFTISQDNNTLGGTLTYGGVNYIFTLTRQ